LLRSDWMTRRTVRIQCARRRRYPIGARKICAPCNSCLATHGSRALSDSGH
jgi:hypothetical protein